MEKLLERPTSSSRTRLLAMTALFAALGCVATTVIKVPSPTGGYMNLGDTAVLPISLVSRVTLLPEALAVIGSPPSCLLTASAMLFATAEVSLRSSTSTATFLALEVRSPVLTIS